MRLLTMPRLTISSSFGHDRIHGVSQDSRRRHGQQRWIIKQPRIHGIAKSDINLNGYAGVVKPRELSHREGLHEQEQWAAIELRKRALPHSRSGHRVLVPIVRSSMRTLR